MFLRTTRKLAFQYLKVDTVMEINKLTGVLKVIRKYRDPYSDHRPIAELHTFPSNGKVDVLVVRDPYRGNGFGRELLKVAHSDIYDYVGPKPEHMWGVTHNEWFRSIPGVEFVNPVNPNAKCFGYRVSLDDPRFTQWLIAETRT